ncbi:MAG: hypothetical protein JW883_05410 [Deltaproteobacteria bacterium]|nr:hypothetical protein [Deltaproteobacteria bacterium]
MATKNKENKKAETEGGFVCPLCLAVGCLRDMVDRESPFFNHMNNARIEFLEGVKALIDARIEAVKKGAGSKKSKLTKIKVED